MVQEIRRPVLVQHKLSLMRSKTPHGMVFRRLLREISQMLAYRVTRDLPIGLSPIETPITTIDAPMIGGKKAVCDFGLARAGNGILDVMLDLLPTRARWSW